MAKPKKIMKTCPTCDGDKILPDEIRKFLPGYPNKVYKCTNCKGKGFVFVPPK